MQERLLSVADALDAVLGVERVLDLGAFAGRPRPAYGLIPIRAQSDSVRVPRMWTITNLNRPRFTTSQS